MRNFIFGVVVGAAVGVATTYFVLQKNLDDRLQEETEEIKEYYYNRFAKDWVESSATAEEHAELVAEAKVDEDDIHPEDKTPIVIPPKNYAAFFNKRVATETKLSDLPTISNKHALIASEQSAEVVEEITEPGVVDGMLDPNLFPVVEDDDISESIYVITPWEFEEQYRTHDKATLVYYDDNATLTTEECEVLVDAEAYIGQVGTDILSDWFSEESQIQSHGEHFYIRNHDRDMDYQITWVDYAFDPD